MIDEAYSDNRAPGVNGARVWHVGDTPLREPDGKVHCARGQGPNRFRKSRELDPVGIGSYLTPELTLYNESLRPSDVDIAATWMNRFEHMLIVLAGMFCPQALASIREISGVDIKAMVTRYDQLLRDNVLHWAVSGAELLAYISPMLSSRVVGSLGPRHARGRQYTTHTEIDQMAARFDTEDQRGVPRPGRVPSVKSEHVILGDSSVYLYTQKGKGNSPEASMQQFHLDNVQILSEPGAGIPDMRMQAIRYLFEWSVSDYPGGLVPKFITCLLYTSPSPRD